MRIMTTSPNETKPGRIILEKYVKIALELEVEVLLFPSSFLPYYKNTNHFYNVSRITKLPTSIPKDSKLLIITGVNEEDESTGAKYKTVVAFDSNKIINIHRKIDLERHYIEKGFSPGSGGDFSFVYGELGLRTLECYESLFEHNYSQDDDIVLVSIGFGMKAKTANYDCDYFDEWLTILRGMAIKNKCWIVTSCNAVHNDIMTVIISRNGKICGMAQNKGILIQDIPLPDFDGRKSPYEQNINNA